MIRFLRLAYEEVFNCTNRRVRHPARGSAEIFLGGADHFCRGIGPYHRACGYQIRGRLFPPARGLQRNAFAFNVRGDGRLPASRASESVVQVAGRRLQIQVSGPETLDLRS